MRLRTRLLIAGVVSAIAAWCGMGGVAAAAFPNLSDCPRESIPLGHAACIDIQSVAGLFEIKGFRVPLDHSLEIRGGLTTGGELTFVPPRGTNGFFAEPVRVPGGLLGFELPFEFEKVTATAELAGSASQIHIDPVEQSIAMPIKVRLANPLLGRNCHIGSNSHPINLSLIIGTTSPPPPNRPITGRSGTFEEQSPIFFLRGGVDVENSFSIPGATECGGLLEANNLLVDLKLGLPSAGGNNSISITNETALEFTQG